MLYDNVIYGNCLLPISTHSPCLRRSKSIENEAKGAIAATLVRFSAAPHTPPPRHVELEIATHN